MSRWPTSLITPPQGLDGSHPAILTPRDPYAGDDIHPRPGTWANYERFAPTTSLLSAEAHGKQDAQFRKLYRAILDGNAPWDAINPVIASLQIDSPIRHDTRPLSLAEHPITDRVLAEMAEDQVPDIGLVAPDAILGPFADDRLSCHIRRQAGAVMALSPILSHGRPPVARVLHQRPRPRTPFKTSIRAIAKTPPMIWRHCDGVLTPTLPLSPKMIPRHPVDCALKSPVVIGRCVFHTHGAWLSCVIPLPQAPPTEIIMRRMRLEVYRLRRHDRRVSWEDVLRQRADVLTRTACEWCWLNCPEETHTVWQSGSHDLGVGDDPRHRGD